MLENIRKNFTAKEDKEMTEIKAENLETKDTGIYELDDSWKDLEKDTKKIVRTMQIVGGVSTVASVAFTGLVTAALVKYIRS